MTFQDLINRQSDLSAGHVPPRVDREDALTCIDSISLNEHQKKSCFFSQQGQMLHYL